MKKGRNLAWIAFLLSLFFVLPVVGAEGDNFRSDAWKAGTGTDDWSVLLTARSGESTDGTVLTDYYLDAVADAEKTEEPARATDLALRILALTAVGADVTNLGGFNLLSLSADYNFATRQGINGAAWTLLALDCAGYTPPGDSEPSVRERLIRYLLERQLDGGGWSLGGGDADPDVTAMVLQALAPYRTDEENAIADASARAFGCLSSLQREDGGFASWGSVNPESVSQVILAMTAWSIPPDDSRFVKNGSTPTDALLRFSLPDGTFCRSPGGNADRTATVQAQCALTALQRQKEEKPSFYRMSDRPERFPVSLTFTDADCAATEALPEKVHTGHGTAVRRLYTKWKLADNRAEYAAQGDKLTAMYVRLDALYAEIGSLNAEIAALDGEQLSAELIADLRSRYNRLSQADRELVTSYPVLERAESALQRSGRNRILRAGLFVSAGTVLSILTVRILLHRRKRRRTSDPESWGEKQ